MLPKIILLVFVVTSLADEQRTCYKCQVKNQCTILDTSSVEKCLPDVRHCVKKIIVSKATGVSVTERYCGGRDFLDQGTELVENKCYTDVTHSRTEATVCYCNSNYCNGGNGFNLALLLLLCNLFAYIML
ncbi:hypothetical protein SK128_006032 [Halocaridina rubra]|uniref:Protein sleepless n=1 Tax=Halocaridina rubra TaxID=373956 RepID=A0AAN9A369_HALRR